MQKTKIRTETREPEQTPEPTLERLVQETSYREREACLMELRGAIAAILQPRGGYHFYAGSNARHFMKIPDPWHVLGLVDCYLHFCSPVYYFAENMPT